MYGVRMHVQSFPTNLPAFVVTIHSLIVLMVLKAPECVYSHSLSSTFNLIHSNGSPHIYIAMETHTYIYSNGSPHIYI